MKKNISSAISAARQLLWCSLIAEEFSRLGVRHIFICPGSRNAPLATAFAAHPKLHCVVHFDERGAGFAALGTARATGTPAIVITTSGTAVANLLPAVLEAKEDALPLILLTADRPPELRGCGANQTCDQTNILAQHCRYFFDLPAHDSSFPPANLLSTIDEAHSRCLFPLGGPSQLNIQMREPLLAEDMDPPYPILASELKKKFTPQESSPLRTWLANKDPHIKFHSSTTDTEKLYTYICTHSPKLILCGALRSEQEQSAVLRLTYELQIPCIADICSGLRGRTENIFSSKTLPTLFPNTSQPIPTLRVGGRFINPLVEKWCAAQNVLQITDGRRINPLHSSRNVITAHIEILSADTNSTAIIPPAQLASKQTGDLLVDSIQKSAPPGCALFLGNSLPVRIFDDAWTGRSDITRIAANRGVSGIDGNIATAIGCAMAWKCPTLCIVGDQTTLHDMNSLSLVRNLNPKKSPFTLLIINNGGGRIFDRLGHTKLTKNPELFWGTPVKNFSHIAALWNIPHQRLSSPKQLARLINKSLKHQVIELITT